MEVEGGGSGRGGVSGGKGGGIGRGRAVAVRVEGGKGGRKSCCCF